jgi:hypothetical protein
MQKGLPDRTPAQTVTIVTKGWLRRCGKDDTGGCRILQALSKHWFPGSFESTVTTLLLQHLLEGCVDPNQKRPCPSDYSRHKDAESELRSLSEPRGRGDDGWLQGSPDFCLVDGGKL